MPGGGRGGSAGDAGSSHPSPQTLKITIPVILISVGIILSIILIMAIKRIRRRHPEMKAYGDQVREPGSEAPNQ